MNPWERYAAPTPPQPPQPPAPPAPPEGNGGTPSGPWAKFAAPAIAPNPDGTYGEVPEGFVLNPATGQMVDMSNPNNPYVPEVLGGGAAGAAAIGAGQGLGFGGFDEIVAALSSIGGPEGSYDFNVARMREAERRAQEDNRGSYTGGLIGGSILGALGVGEAAGALGLVGKSAQTAGPVAQAARSGLGLPTAVGTAAPGLAARVGGGAAVGAGMGAAQGFGSGEGGIGNRLEDALTGAVFGGSVGGAIPVVGKVASGFGNAVAGLGSAALSHVFPSIGNAPDMTAGGRAIIQALQRSGKSEADVTAALAQAATEGQPMYTVTDAIGRQARSKLNSIARQPGAAQETIADNLMRRQVDQGPRLTGFVNDALGVQKTAKQTIEQLLGDSRTAAAPLYEKAFAGGSTAPLTHQFEQQFGKLVEQEREAAAAVAAAKSAALGRAGRNATLGGDVYVDQSTKVAAQNADRAVADAEAALAAAQAQKQDALDLLRRAQADGTANAPGAVWSPRVQQFLADPIAKRGLSRGLEIQRLEALAEGRSFNPTEYAIVGTDAAGEPIVGAVPNMRLLDAVKRGLDAIIDENTGDFGRLNEMGRAVAKVKQSYLGELDALNGDYAAARAAVAGPMEVKDAIQTGADMTGMRAEDAIDTYRGASDSAKPGMRVGFADVLGKRMEGRLGANNVPALEAHGKAPVLREMAADPELLQRQIAREGDMFKTYGYTQGGSQTMSNAADMTDAQRALGSFVGESTANSGYAIRRLAGRIGDWMLNGMTGENEATRSAIADALLSTDLAAALKPYLDAAAQQQLYRDVGQAGARAGIMGMFGGQQ